MMPEPGIYYFAHGAAAAAAAPFARSQAGQLGAERKAHSRGGAGFLLPVTRGTAQKLTTYL